MPPSPSLGASERIVSPPADGCGKAKERAREGPRKIKQIDDIARNVGRGSSIRVATENQGWSVTKVAPNAWLAVLRPPSNGRQRPPSKRGRTAKHLLPSGCEVKPFDPAHSRDQLIKPEKKASQHRPIKRKQPKMEAVLGYKFRTKITDSI